MAMTTNTAGTIAKAAGNTAAVKTDPKKVLNAYIAKMEGQIAKALPSVLTPERFSQSYGSDFSPWKTSFDAMAKKTVLKQVLRYAPLKSDFVKAVASDGTIKHDIAPDMSEVPTVADYVVDGDTGEVIEVNVAEGGGPA